MKLATQEDTSTRSIAPKAGRLRRIAYRLSALFGAISVALFGFAGAADAQVSSPTSASQAFQTAGSGLSTQLLLVVGAIVIPAVTILAVKKGWPLLKRFF
jgi:hypothetical protein